MPNSTIITANLRVEHLDLIITAQSNSPAAAGALEDLTIAYAPAIRAASHASKALDSDDAYQVAAEAFVLAVRNYDPDSDLPFAATVSSILRAAVLREARASDLVRVKDNTAAKYWRLMHKHNMDANAAYEECLHEVNDFTSATFLAAHAALGGVETFDPHNNEADVILADRAPQPDDAIIRADYVEWLYTHVSDVQESILRLRYGFDDLATANLLAAWNEDNAHILYPLGEVLDDARVGDVIDMPRATVNRQAHKALDAMRAADAEALAAEIAAEQ
ncbi:hypothetical protein OG474_09805 [Kribbella sp. NBC_01505]|uniref:hypothetical protein n=1 Tax=Kribbella sp. NBC_01505 TaxID=2903580 RepID=UPI003864567D